MFGILLSALNTIAAFVFRQVVVKFFVLFAIFFIIEAFVGVLGEFIPDPSSLDGALGSLISGMWWFLDLFAFSQGASLVMTASVYRFLIRRIPFIG
ncbi:MAG: hypothetical protein GAK35_04244 [Herbaspirillum frisingense]|uniref:DUF2523 domain-containing protein n=1 Tax=Herbaspirillum frisingense TaxID=92645 RepID=A0A7V8FSU2_9BURK|nr:MAG: hypothetical protein GAK35_04244 [Herbaspirillum frisingense]